MKIEAKRLILRDPRLGDWDDVVEGIWDLELAKEMSEVPKNQRKKYPEFFVKRKNVEYLLFLELKSEKKVIGAIEVLKKEKGIVSSWINKKYSKQGYIPEAKLAAKNHLLNESKLKEQMRLQAISKKKHRKLK